MKKFIVFRSLFLMLPFVLVYLIPRENMDKNNMWIPEYWQLALLAIFTGLAWWYRFYRTKKSIDFFIQKQGTYIGIGISQRELKDHDLAADFNSRTFSWTSICSGPHILMSVYLFAIYPDTTISEFLIFLSFLIFFFIIMFFNLLISHHASLVRSFYELREYSFSDDFICGLLEPKLSEFIKQEKIVFESEENTARMILSKKQMLEASEIKKKFLTIFVKELKATIEKPLHLKIQEKKNEQEDLARDIEDAKKIL